MGKRLRKHMQLQGKSKLGCMWSWLSMFEFGHGNANQKLLSDKSRKKLNVSDNGDPKSKLKMLKDVNEIGQLPESGLMGGELVRDNNKLSVKRLIEEEMVKDCTKKRNKIALSGSEFGSLVKRNQKKVTTKCNTSSQINIPDINTTKKFGSDDSGSDLYIEAIMQEIFNHIQQKSMSWSNNKQNEPLHSDQKLSLLEERISEATKAIMHQKFFDGEHLTEARKVQYYNKYMDTLEMLDTNKEFFLKLSEDPNSSNMKQIKKMPTNSSSQKPCLNLRLSEENDSDSQYTFFRRKLQVHKGDESNGKSKNSESSNKIVILKPERNEMRASATESSVLVKYNTASHFSLSEIRKKLRLAMQKDRHGTSSGNVASMSPYKFQKQRFVNNVFEKDHLGMRSPSRFFVEKIPKPSTGSKNKSDVSAKQRVSSIYIEAKRHLSELLSKGDEEEDDISSGQTPKTLERFISAPECNILNCRVPGRHSFDHNITGGRLFTSTEAQPCSKNSQETESVNQVELNDLWSPSSETDFCASDDNYPNAPEACNVSSNNDKETLVKDKELTIIMHSLSDISTSEGAEKVAESTDSQAETAESAPYVICESASIVSSSDDQNTCLDNIDEVEASEKNEQDPHKEYRASSPSPLAHPFFSTINIDIDDLASTADKSERPSPISVLEYVFSEDEFSPAGSEYLGSVEQRRLRPIRIKFDQDEQSSTAHDAYIQGCVDNREIAYKYVKALMSSTELCWEELYMTFLFSSQLLNETLFDEVEGLFSQLYYDDRRLLFDCVNEILSGMCQKYFGGCPLISFQKLNIRPLPNPHHTIREVWEGVEWHLLPPPHPQSLEQIVQKDLERDAVWMNLSLDVEELSIDIETVILQELMEDAVLSCIEILVR